MHSKYLLLVSIATWGCMFRHFVKRLSHVHELTIIVGIMVYDDTSQLSANIYWNLIATTEFEQLHCCIKSNEANCLCFVYVHICMYVVDI